MGRENFKAVIKAKLFDKQALGDLWYNMVGFQVEKHGRGLHCPGSLLQL